VGINYEEMLFAKNESHMDFDDISNLFFYQISTKIIIKYSANTFKKALKKKWLEKVPIKYLLRTSALRMFLETGSVCTVQYDQKFKSIITNFSKNDHKFCLDSLWPANTGVIQNS
jgi:hypothetical protein